MNVILEKLSKISPPRIILLGFLGVIFLGSLLLSLPIATRSGEATPYVDALFTSTTSVCVTGLVTVNTLEHWNLFGHIVILLLIQFGGLGFVAVMTAMMLITGKKLSLKERILIQEAYSFNKLSGLVKFTRSVLIGTLTVELCGAIFYMFQFIPQFGLVRGIWISIFNAVSAFCNAGIDIIGPNSLVPYVQNPLINLVTMTLIVSGGIGFTVWWDVLRVGKLCIKKEIQPKRIFQRLSLHTKIVLTTTISLIIGGAILIFLLEYRNVGTIGNFSIFGKIQASLFQSVTLRTAGFATFAQENLRDDTSLICIILMFIGGSPVGTAGGIKTVTIAVLFATVISVVRGHKNVVIYNRKVSIEYVKKSLAIICISLFFLLVATILLNATELKADFMTCLYEVASALGTVGLSKNLTPSLSVLGKIIIIISMYIGRVGPITMAVGFNIKSKKTLIEFPEEDILVG